ncbi:MAG: oligosaccharide flippase family protein, partial [Novosphingobium sp.]|nr:oligosaccharide flippase family protein [Novosphingobium sp.]
MTAAAAPDVDPMPADPMLADPTLADPMLATPPAESLKRRSIEGAAVMTASQVVRIVIQLGSQILLARLLFAADFGLLAMVMPVVSFIQIFA